MAQGMQPGPAGGDQLERFNKTYELRAKCLTCLEIERRVYGCDYGATSWTTKSEADEILKTLELNHHSVVLDIGSGAGWPALYLAQQSGCDVTLTDLPFDGLKIAATRVRNDGLASQCQAAVASAAALPFGGGRFDAITHSDVLCCLEPKHEVLETCRRVITDHGKMVFTVIYITPGLEKNDYDQAVEFGPPYVETPKKYDEMLAHAGWRMTQRQDLTAQYLQTAKDLLAMETEHETEVRDAMGAEDYEVHIDGLAGVVKTIAAGLTCREMFVVTPI